ncbi:hypothetical protein ASG43_21815 [Aureimonas sp. Leaf454]|uniref:hypothetical protein n=1 Tax=Aureimonas sp. Leaf454 TaxID=1736381 RepID=UPI0006FBA63A|nr:hypothetical protein [Aureimonas sp. Leaf454]KQT50195.1 hypothetical protein ASG43_21815 [Aureimonas sp. Leaf454]
MTPTRSSPGPSRIFALARAWIEPVVSRSYVVSACGRVPTRDDFAAHQGLMMCERVGLAHLGVLMSYVEPAARLKPDPSADGGEGAGLRGLLDLVHGGWASPDEILMLFRLLRPYTSGNERCARALWLWRVLRSDPGEAEMALRDFLDATDDDRPAMRPAS